MKNNFTFNSATYAIFWIALFCAFSLLTVALTFINGDLRLQLADEKERATFYRECLLSDDLSDPCRSWIMLERFGVEIGETYLQAD